MNCPRGDGEWFPLSATKWAHESCTCHSIPRARDLSVFVMLSLLHVMILDARELLCLGFKAQSITNRKRAMQKKSVKLEETKDV
jgi:hypothetical protein